MQWGAQADVVPFGFKKSAQFKNIGRSLDNLRAAELPPTHTFQNQYCIYIFISGGISKN